jgi:hypothetical protein
MLKFASLTLAQKRFVVSYLEANPSVKTNPKVTLKEVSAHYNELAANRDATGVKLGVPNWLFKANKVDRGIYQMPVPNDMELNDYAKELAYATNKKTKVAAPKVAKVAKVKVAPKVKTTPKVVAASDIDEEVEQEISGSRLNRIIDESEYVDEDVEDFNQILRDNGIEV